MAELISIALLAYRNGHYTDAVALLEQAVAKDPGDWIVRLYLGLSYGKLNRNGDSLRHLESIVADCPDQEVCERAQDALRQLERQSKSLKPVPSMASSSPDNEAVGGG
jgi:tetratricopeptide (TPR) repeat protein